MDQEIQTILAVKCTYCHALLEAGKDFLIVDLDVKPNIDYGRQRAIVTKKVFCNAECLSRHIKIYHP